MKSFFFVSLLSLSMGAIAQTAANNNSSSSATTSAQGNSQSVSLSSPATLTANTNTSALGNLQSITFTSPDTVKSNSTLTSNSTSTSTNNQNVNTSGTSKNIVEYSGDYTIKNVPSVSGPNLTTSNDTCMGSSSGGANGPGFGVSFGSTWTDEHCKRLKMSRELWNKGMKAASLAMDCMDVGARAALEMTGTMCPQSMTAEERRKAFGPQASTTGAVPATPAPTPDVISSAVSSPVTQSNVTPIDLFNGVNPRY